MKTFKIAVAVVLSMLVAANALAAESVTRASGGSVQVKGEYDIVWLNENSRLKREWITVHDESIPADLIGTVGVDVRKGDARVSYNYHAKYSIAPKEDLSAIEIRFLLFDIWGKHTRNLSATDVEDLPSGSETRLTGAWYASANAAQEHYASIAYIARVRTKSGRVIEANTKTVLEEARKFSKKFSESDLEPQPPKE